MLPQNPGQTNQPANPLPFDSCAEFATWLAGIATDALLTGHVKGYGQRLTARLWGSDLAKLAYSGYERHIHNAFEGFKPELVSAGENSPQGPQGAGVYGHLLFSSGMRLIQNSGDPGGAAAYHLNRFKDWAQAWSGNSQYPSERAGNIAGRAVGDALWNYLGG